MCSVKDLSCNFIKKEALAQVFSCELYKIFKATFSPRTPPVTANNQKAVIKKADSLNYATSSNKAC